jgi:hypothetical protein
MRDIRTASSEIKWSELVYVQRDVENKDQFAKNWDLIFKKGDINEKEKENAKTLAKEVLNANNENNNEVGQDRL